MSAAAPLLAVEGLRVFHDATEVVHGVSLAFPASQVSAVLGVNGAGKTALALALAGLLRSAGRITFRGQPIERMTPWARSHRGLALVQEGRRLFHGMTVAENLGLAAWRRGRSKAEIARQLAFVHDLFPVLKRKGPDPASRLSGGEQQMLAVGQGLMTFPTLLVLDEPTAGLAPKIVGDMLEAIGRLAREGYSTLVIDQSVANVRRVARTVAVMRLGHLVGVLPVEAVDDALVAQYLA